MTRIPRICVSLLPALLILSHDSPAPIQLATDASRPPVANSSTTTNATPLTFHGTVRGVFPPGPLNLTGSFCPDVKQTAEPRGTRPAQQS